MIKLESAHIEEVRGIRKLDITFGKDTFSVSGPNGSGKSGVIDAIEFALTGKMSRLTGAGTKGLSVAEHGPHVDKTKFPDAAFVSLTVHFQELGKTATITRKVSAPKKPTINPNEPDIRAAFDEIAGHPEITLSRRDILRFILIEPTKRSEEIQAILKLDEIGQTRAALNTAANRLQSGQKLASTQVDTSRDNLQRHLQIAEFRAPDLLSAVNARRKALGLPEIATLAANTKLDAGLSGGDELPEFNKASQLRDLEALSGALEKIGPAGAEPATIILAAIARLEADPSLLDAFQRRALIEKGLELLDGAECPLCDHSWDDEDHLRKHLETKLSKSGEAAKLQAEMLGAGSILAQYSARLGGLIAPVVKIAAEHNDAARLLLDRWTQDLETFKGGLSDLQGLVGMKSRLERGWHGLPGQLATMLVATRVAVDAKPDQTAHVDAHTFLTTAQLRLDEYRKAMRKGTAAQKAARLGKAAYDAYCDVMETELNALYDSVEKDFSTYYKAVNEDDEVKFTAKLSPSEGKLDFNVNFYERGLFPPGAYHSEGHQDGMGVCLYLALMKRLFGDRFTLALLDDVVMSVDSGHRYQFCKLLKSYFPNTQFIITTHDRLWAEQMRSAGLVTAKTSLAFHSWTVDTGPLVESNEEIWDEIAAALSRGRVETAAHGLRHHLEYASRHLADQLAARPAFRSDGNYELGELLPSVLVRMKELCGKAADAAQSWGNTAAKEEALSRKTALSESNGARSVEQWAVNKAVHYNEWANFGKKDFEPVIAAFKSLLECFRCDDCGSWLYASPKPIPESLRCACNKVTLNLKSKPK
jgi:recombinational DNA repair ATPase RecF